MDALLEVRDLAVSFTTDEGVVQAVDGLSLSVSPGEVVAIVGESGSGKSVTALTIMGLTRSPNARFEGAIDYKGADLMRASDDELRRVRGAEIAMIFQDPMTSLNPVLRIGDQIAEQVLAHEQLPKEEANERAIEMLERVGIPRARDRAGSYPHEFSGGMRQRVMIAMALSCHPSVLIADEPSTAIEVTIQAQILEQIRGLRASENAGVILVTHDLGVVARAGHARRDLLRPAAPVHMGPDGIDHPLGRRAAGALAGDLRGAPIARVASRGLPLPAALSA
jgi:peptide/nickel transport system ATP-binding protein